MANVKVDEDEAGEKKTLVCVTESSTLRGNTDDLLNDFLDNGLSIPFFRSDLEVGQYDVKNNNRMNGLHWKDKRDIVYKKAVKDTISSTTARTPDFVYYVTRNVQKSSRCPSMTMAWVYITAAGLPDTIDDLPFSRTDVYIDIILYLQNRVPDMKGSSSQNNINSVLKHGENRRVDRKYEAVELGPVFLAKMVKSFVINAARVCNISQTDVIRLLINNAVISSKRFSKADKNKANTDRKAILDTVYVTTNEIARVAMDMCRMYKPFFEEEDNIFIEKQLKRIDVIWGTPHCKYCLSNDTKLRRDKTAKRKAQYKCKQCGRLFTPKN